MANIGTSLDHHVEGFLTGMPEELGEPILSKFRDILQVVCNGGDPALTRLIDLRRDLGFLAERLCNLDHSLRLMKLQFDRIAPLAIDQADCHAREAAEYAKLRHSVDDLYRAISDVAESIDEAMGPRVEELFCLMIVAVQAYADERVLLN